MVELTLGKVNNEERKFIPTKKVNFVKYIEGLEKVEEYKITQTFEDGYKFRCYDDGKGLSFTKSKKIDKISDIVEIDEATFNNVLNRTGKCIKKTRRTFKDGSFKIDVDYFSKPVVMILVEVSTSGDEKLGDYKVPSGFVDVTGNSIYDNSNIYNGSIISNGTILEGTDGVGKTTAIEALLKRGIICQDRCNDVISANMLFEIPMEQRTERYHEYLKKNDKKVIILVNNDKAELERRIYSRAEVSEFDKLAYEYNVLYLDTFNYMNERNMLEGKMFLLDCTGLSVEDVTERLKNIILN